MVPPVMESQVQLCNYMHRHGSHVENMKPLLTIENIATYLTLSRDTVYRLVQTGKIPATKVGYQWRFNAKDIEDWLNQNKNTSGRAAPRTKVISRRKRQ